MIYLFVQTWGWIFAAGLLGLFIGWLIWGKRNARESADTARLRRQLDECRDEYRELERSVGNLPQVAIPVKSEMPAPKEAPNVQISETDNPLSESTTDKSTDDDAEILDDWKPTAMAAPDGEADDLKRVKGIGPVIEKTLNELGIYHFKQVAAFTEENIKWVDNYIAFPGRIQRENWVAQAIELSAGGETEFSNRYDKK